MKASNEPAPATLHIYWCTVGLLLMLFTAISAEAHAAPRALPSNSFASNLLSIEQLPRFRPVAHAGAFTSYDRTGGNDDGFSGKYSYLRKEGDALVIAEVEGAGAITRIYTPTPINAPLEFYFDGELAPSVVLPFDELFTGGKPPFVKPLTGHALGGYYSYVPIEFAKSIKIAVRTKHLRFYHINYVVYRPEVPARTFVAGQSFTLPSVDATGTVVSGELTLAQGRTATLWERSKPGRIEWLKLAPASAFAGTDRDILLRVYWDGAQQPAIDIPVGDFFGYSFGRPATQSLLFGTQDDENYIRFPMPFEKSARIELVSERQTQRAVKVKWELTVSDRGKEAQEGFFHTAWRRENPTVDGQPFTYLNVSGRGHVVGTILQAQGLKLGRTPFFEGDDKVIADGKLAINGTGSEDAFNGGWYAIPGRWKRQLSLPFSGCLEYDEALARTGGYRVFLADAYSFERSLSYTIEHGYEKNNIPTDYAGTTFFYLDRPAGVSRLPPVEERRVMDPKGFSLEFYPSMPTITELLGASLKLGVTEGKEPKYFMSFARNVVGPGADIGSTDFGTEIGSPTIAFSIDVVASGRYAIWVDALTGPESAMLQLRVDDDPVGTPVDFYSSTARLGDSRKLGELYLSHGKNLLHLTMPGRNTRSGGAAVDIIRIHGQRLYDNE